MEDELVLVLAKGVCQVCQEDRKALYHSRAKRGPLACERCWAAIREAEQKTEGGNDETEGTER
jgi:hypothetical protein